MDNEHPNPYAPPKAEGPIAGTGAHFASPMGRPAADVAAALARLKAHVAPPDNVAADLKRAGGLLRPVTIVFLALAVGASVGTCAAAAMASDGDKRTITLVIGIMTFVFGLIAVIALAVDIRMGRRDAPAPPDLAVRRLFRGMSMGRYGYVWAMLSPSAREQSVSPPALGPIKIGEGSFSMREPSGLKAYAATFVRQGQNQMRMARVKSATVRSAAGDVALVDVEAMFTSWPLWVTVMLGVCAGVFRIGIVVALVLLFVLRKRQTVTFTKTMLQGQPGVWYAYDANLLDSFPGIAPPPPRR